jgi:Transposase DDE domain/Zinc-binding dehydrogenase
MSILDLFCSVDDFWQWFAPQWGPAPASASSTRPRWPPGNRDDRRPVPQLLRRVRQRVGELFADRGYISQPLAEQLLVEHGVQLITKLRKNMHNRLLDPSDKRLMGGRVVGAFRQASREAEVRQAGAHEVVIGEDLAPAGAFGPYPLILESVGGASLGTALTLLAPEGMCVVFGESAAGAAAFSPSGFYSPGGTSLYGFNIFYEVTRQSPAQGLARLVRLVADGRLHPRIAVEAPWGEVAQVARQLMDRAYLGKAVLQVV